jgi:hypothetical protein
MQADNVIPFPRKAASTSPLDAALLAFDFGHSPPVRDRSEDDCKAVLAWASRFMQRDDKPFDFKRPLGAV